MPAFDPIKMFKWVWAMKRWGHVLVVATIVLTAFAILSSFLWFSGTNYKVAVFSVYALAVIVWVILILYYLETISRLKKNLDKLITKGEWIRGIMGGDTDTDFDRNEDHIQQWALSVAGVLKGTEYEQDWKRNVGLVVPEELPEVLGLTLRFLAQRKHMAQRLSRLREIRDSL